MVEAFLTTPAKRAAGSAGAADFARQDWPNPAIIAAPGGENGGSNRPSHWNR
jgi:hypothetical protein